MGGVSDPRLTVQEAAHIARTSDEQVRTALANGDLRNLRLSNVRAWSRGGVAARISKGMQP